jgi:uncharacterized membrane protein YccC
VRQVTCSRDTACCPGATQCDEFPFHHVITAHGPAPRPPPGCRSPGIPPQGAEKSRAAHERTGRYTRRMHWPPGRLGERLSGGANRIALSTASRGTLATVVPLAVLPHTGLADIGYPAVLGALATSLVDVGGPYRTRLVAMLVQALGGSCLLLLGNVSAEHWWLAAAVMAAIGVLSGLIRAVGPAGPSLGTNTAVAFLVGLQLASVPAARAGPWAMGYAAGGVWTVAIALIFWQLRPYRRLEYEVAAAWEAVALLLRVPAAVKHASAVGRLRREREVGNLHAELVAALERSREAVGDIRAGMAGPGTTVAQMIVLIDAAAAMAGTGITLCELDASSGTSARLARACRAVARVLLAGKGELQLSQLRDQVRSYTETAGGLPHEELTALTHALRTLDIAEEALRVLFGVKRRLPDLVRLPFAHRLPRGTIMTALRAHATPRSAVFRHAIRVALVTAADTALLVYLRLPRGIWLPLTSLTILQPEYGSTVTRAMHRTLGTIAGAVIAGALLATVHGTAAYDVALGVLLFATFLVIRRNYAYGITFLTPIVILLISQRSLDPWVDLAERVAYTVAGAILALVAAYLLWPQWERDQLRDRLQRALQALQRYLDGVLQSLAGAAVSPESIASLRRQAELALANAEAGFQRMRAEPGDRAELLGVAFALLVNLRRLCRHTIALSLQHQGAPLSLEPLTKLRQLIAAALGDLGKVVAEGRMPVPWPSLESQLDELVSQLSPETARETSLATGPLGRIVSDLIGLLGAAGYQRDTIAPSRGALSST